MQIYAMHCVWIGNLVVVLVRCKRHTGYRFITDKRLTTDDLLLIGLPFLARPMPTAAQVE